MGLISSFLAWRKPQITVPIVAKIPAEGSKAVGSLVQAAVTVGQTKKALPIRRKVDHSARKVMAVQRAVEQARASTKAAAYLR